jgi:SAM-dependent methyltransferase
VDAGGADLERILACPYCTGALVREGASVRCSACGRTFAEARAGQLDARVAEKTVRLETTVGPVVDPGELPLGPLRPSPQPALDWEADAAPYRIPAELLTYFPRADSAGLALDVACGIAHHRAAVERTGHRYVGVDIAGDQATLLADAHALPFRSETFDFALSIATIEHLRYPHLAVAEIARVLKPGGLLVGTVAFLEPFHGNSYLHHTHLGIASSLRDAGFAIEVLAAVPGWSVLEAQAQALFPRMPKRAALAAVAPLRLLHRAWWRGGAALRHSERSSPLYRQLSLAGSLAFVARRGMG